MSTGVIDVKNLKTESVPLQHPWQSAEVYPLFEAAQVQTFREAFNLIDQDRDGIISESDLRELLTSLGQHPDPALLEALLHARPAAASSSSSKSDRSRPPPPPPPGQLNFTSFVTLMASYLSPLDPEFDMLEAFASFDENNTGTCDASEVRQWLKTTGDRMSDAEVDKLLHPPFLDRKTNQFNYRLFCQSLRVSGGEDHAGQVIPT